MLKNSQDMTNQFEKNFTAIENSANKKLLQLQGILQEMGSVLVAFSAGVDSAFLLQVASEVLGKDAVALTATSPTYLEDELEEAKALTKELGVKHIIIDSNELLIPNFAENPTNRCYYCKSELFGLCVVEAKKLGIAFVVDGTNIDDQKDIRPGKTAGDEKKVRSPLEEASLTKEEIRFLSKKAGLRTWKKPNLACLSSRFPYGTQITEDRLKMIKQAEKHLRSLGFIQFRVRYHNETARVEVAPDEMNTFLDSSIRESIVDEFKKIGFTYVTADLEGYRTGSMNEVLSKDTSL